MKRLRLLIEHAVIALTILVLLNRKDITASVLLIRQANWPLLLLIPFVQTTSFFAKANHYKVTLRNFRFHA